MTKPWADRLLAWGTNTQDASKPELYSTEFYAIEKGVRALETDNHQSALADKIERLSSINLAERYELANEVRVLVAENAIYKERSSKPYEENKMTDLPEGFENAMEAIGMGWLISFMMSQNLAVSLYLSGLAQGRREQAEKDAELIVVDAEHTTAGYMQREAARKIRRAAGEQDD